MKRRVESYKLRREKMKNYAMGLAEKDYSKSNEVTLKWSEVLESAFDYYYAEYIPAWALNETSFNNCGDKLFISKKSNEWVSWEKIAESERPDIATLFDLLPDLPGDDQYRQILREIRNSGIEEPEDYFWENMFSYKQANEVKINGKKYRIEWEA
ncbi:MAG TPA: hypothetical protein VNN20_07660 [Thermodesulfobacteriota bacterium]|nr:hypothetical protein [Thermodesulfobacteriota bacterium]